MRSRNRRREAVVSRAPFRTRPPQLSLDDRCHAAAWSHRLRCEFDPGHGPFGHARALENTAGNASLKLRNAPCNGTCIDSTSAHPLPRTARRDARIATRQITTEGRP